MADISAVSVCRYAIVFYLFVAHHNIVQSRTLQQQPSAEHRRKWTLIEQYQKLVPSFDVSWLASPDTKDISAIWKPSFGSREQWLKCHGMPCDQWERTQSKMGAVAKLEKGNENPGFGAMTMDSAGTEQVSEGCLWYTEEQTDQILEEVSSETRQPPHALYPRSGSRWGPLSGYSQEQRLPTDDQWAESLLRTAHQEHTRHKRKLENFPSAPNKRWHNPIFFKFDGSHGPSERDIIRKAFQHWEVNTCMRFFEVNIDAPITQHHLLLTNSNIGCYSFVGKTTTNPQQLNLAASCLTQFGVPVHEIGHSLGLWHEQQRADRDNHVTIHNDRIKFYSSQFWRRKTIDHGVPYDFSSVMHYPWTAGSYTHEQTIEPKDPLYKNSMGQRTGLSYLDAKIINKEYCSDECSGSIPLKCLRGGYHDPNDCSRCRCPDGFSGRYCETTDHADNSPCGGVVNLGKQAVSIQTPGYDSPMHYDDNTECSWLVKAPANKRVRVSFEGDFGVYCQNQETCFHWLEIKYTKDFEYPGPRFCCYRRPDFNLTSETEEMMIIFRSNFPTIWATTRRGFKARLVAVSADGSESVDDPTAGNRDTTPTAAPVATTTPPPPGTYWGEWARCQNSECKCGGCSVSTRHRMCGEYKCSGTSAAMETRPCDRLCTDQDTQIKFAGKFYEAPCPQCCPDYDLQGGKCVEQ